MARFFKNRTLSKGMAPGSLVFIGNQRMESTRINLMKYNLQQYTEEVDLPGENIKSKIEPSLVNWLNIYGLHEPEAITEIGEVFELSSLLLEDAVNTDQRPKFEESDQYSSFILKALHYDSKKNTISTDQITIVLMNSLVITFQELSAKHFEPVRERVRLNKGKVRSSGAYYLTYCLIDTLVDNYLEVISTIGDQIEELSRKVITRPKPNVVNDIYKFKVELNFLRKNIRPVKEMVMLWMKAEPALEEKKNKAYLRDLLDLVTQAEESIDVYNSLLADGVNIYNSNLANRTNEIVKVLTVFSTIFIPLTFLAGVYGMNFEYMPELGFRYSYPLFWLTVLAITATLIIVLKRRKWL